jgi:hypothetical protein
MPVIESGRRHYSEVVKATSKIESEGAGNYHYARITVDAAADVSIDPVGYPVIWNDTDDAWNLFESQAVPTEDTNLPNGAPVAVAVGPAQGKGVNKEDVLIDGTDGGVLTVLFRGEAIINPDEVQWHANTTAGQKASFILALEKQGIAMQASATDVTPAFV